MTSYLPTLSAIVVDANVCQTVLPRKINPHPEPRTGTSREYLRTDILLPEVISVICRRIFDRRSPMQKARWRLTMCFA
jgi:hypothetical protein